MALILASNLGATPGLAQHDEPTREVRCWVLNPPEYWNWTPSRDDPIEVRPDGSFTKTSTADNLWPGIDGGPVVDVGDGIVAQKITDLNAHCGPEERLLVVDCKTSQMILLEPPERATSDPNELRRRTTDIQPPHGPIALQPDVTIQGLARTAAGHGIRTDTDVMSGIERMECRNRWNPLQGCRILYPNLPGAAR